MSSFSKSTKLILGKSLAVENVPPPPNFLAAVTKGDFAGGDLNV